MNKKIKITDPITNISAIFSGIHVCDNNASKEVKIFSEIYSVENAKERFADDLILAHKLLESKFMYRQAFEEEGHIGWESSLNYREFDYYGELSSIIDRLVVEEI